MTTENTTKVAEAPRKLIENFELREEVSRNNTTLPLVQAQIKRGPYANYVYVHPEVKATKDSLMQAIEFVGLETACDIFKARFQKEGQNALVQYSDADVKVDPEDPTGRKKLGLITVVRQDEFYRALETGSCRGETKRELLEALEEKNGELVEVSEMLNDLDDGSGEFRGASAELVTRMMHITRQIKQIQANLEARKKPGKSVDEDEE